MAYSFTIIEGNLTKDPEFSKTNSGHDICKFSVAVNDNFKKDVVSFYDVIAWGKLAEVCNRYLNKGSKAMVSGKMIQERYKDKNGNNRTSWKLNANEVNFISKVGESQPQQENTDFGTPPSGIFDDKPSDPF
jgi:single-strand DNA-binding protein